MGNNKNKKIKARSGHRHAYVKKKLPWMKKCIKKKQHNNTETEQNDKVLNGSRIINLEQLQEYTDELTKHSSECEGTISLVCETRDGLASTLTGCCSKCQRSITLKSSKKVQGPDGKTR